MTTPRHRQIAIQTTTMALVFGVGILLGQQFCASPPPPPEAPECPEPKTQIIEYCPPDPEPEPQPEPQKAQTPPPKPTPRKSTAETLPERQPSTSPQQRRLLLGWVRSQAPTLQSCPRDLGTTHRLAITLELSPDRQIQNVTLSSDQPLPPDLERCLQQRLQTWQIPDDLQPHHDRLLFHLLL